MKCAGNLSMTLVFSFSRFKIFSSSNASGMVLSEVFSAAWLGTAFYHELVKTLRGHA
jgi:hypothetical protein